MRGEGGEPTVGFEPTTGGLQNRCSTTELCRREGGNISQIEFSCKTRLKVETAIAGVFCLYRPMRGR